MFCFQVLSPSPEPLSLINVLTILPSAVGGKLVPWGRRLAWFRIPVFGLSNSNGLWILASLIFFTRKSSAAVPLGFLRIVGQARERLLALFLGASRVGALDYSARFQKSRMSFARGLRANLFMIEPHALYVLRGGGD
jgi:hypothetical protein